MHDRRRRTDNELRTLTDHNSSPWAFVLRWANKRPTGNGSLTWLTLPLQICRCYATFFPILSSQLMKRSSFKQFSILKNIYGMPVNGAWSFEQTLNGSQLGFTIGTIVAIFDLRVAPMLPTKFRVNWPFCSGEEAKNRFSRWLPSWISDWQDFSYFWSTSHPNVSYKVWSQLAFRWRRRS